MRNLNQKRNRFRKTIGSLWCSRFSSWPGWQGEQVNRSLAALHQARGIHSFALFLAFGLLLLFFGREAMAQINGVYREVYTGLDPGSSSLQSLTNNSDFPNNPTTREVLTNFFEAPRNVGDHYGQRLRALIVPPVTGTYVFWIAADDAGALYLSTDESAFNKMPIAYNNVSALFRSWYTYSSQQSTNI